MVKIVQLLDESKNPISPKVSTGSVIASDGELLENYLGNFVKFKLPEEEIDNYIDPLYKSINYSELNTSDKTVIGSINEIGQQLGNVYGETLHYDNISIDGISYSNANVKIQTLTVSNANSKDETEKSNTFSLAQMVSTDNTTLKNKFVIGRALLCYQTSDGSVSGWKSFYFDSETPPIVVDKIYDQSLTLAANTQLVLTIPSKAGYTAIGLGVCYCGGTTNYLFLMDTETRVLIRNITTGSQTLQTRVSIIYART